MPKDGYLVLTMKKKLGVEIENMPYIPTREMELSWADGMIGAMPVFETREAAMAAYPGIPIAVVGIPE